MATDRLSDEQRALLDFLRANSGKSVTRDEIVAATKWKPSTLKTHVSKGHLAAFLKPGEGNTFLVKSGPNLDEWSLRRQMTQSGSVREVGAPCESNLARALVRKSRDNMILGLELYNRPTLENRLDAFCMLFSTAWEQLLKAEILEKESEDVLYTEKEEGRRPKTISLEKAVEKQFAANDPVKLNILAIAELRHGATHLLMPETQGVLSRLFQAGVLNFAKRFPMLGGVELFPASSSGLMSLISDPEELDVLALRQTYGDSTGANIADLVDSLLTSIEKTRDDQYAITVEYKLVLTKSESKADIRLTTAPDADGPQLAVVEKEVPVDKKFPFSAADLASALAKRIGSSFNVHDITSMVFKEKWKLQNNAFHHHISRFNIHQYSQEAIDRLAENIGRDPTYLQRAREAYGNHLKKESAAKKK